MSKDWGITLYGPNGGVKTISPCKGNVIILCRDPDYIDHTRSRRSLTRQQHDKALERQAERRL